MSITVNIFYNGINGNARKFAEEMESSGTAEAIRNEDGNVKYEYFIPLNNSDTILLIDQWRDQNALDIHHASPMMQKIIELRDKYDLHMKVEKYISNEDEDSASDREFIRN